ncbi:hypothetical protein CPB97_009713 [Podila verticillata]|nr:hypothetical protein CPB97_009713 [Podila verticillata]
MLKTLDLYQAQWTTLGIISANDYNKNIHGLGIASNFGIVKNLKGADVPSLVQEYFLSDQVVIKNADPTKFNAAINVFVKCQQTPDLPMEDLPMEDLPMEDLPKADTPKEDAPKDKAPSWESTRSKYNKIKQDYIDGKSNWEVKKRWKPYQDHTSSPADSVLSQKSKKSKKNPGIKPLLTSNKKIDILRALAWEYPTRTLSMGTLKANIKKVVTDGNMVSDILHCLQQAVRVASDVKRLGQTVLGLYLDAIFVKGHFQESDRIFLDHLCKRVQPKSANNDAEDDATEGFDTADDDLSEGSKQDQFLAMLLRHLLSGEKPRKTVLGIVCGDFIERIKNLGIKFDAPPNPLGLPTCPVTRSVAKQLDVEFKNHYRAGTHDFFEKLKKKQEKGIIPKEVDLKIHGDKSAIENFLALNKIGKNARRMIPVSPKEHGFISLTEAEMVVIFWKKTTLKRKIQELAGTTFPETDQEELNRHDCMNIWLSGQGPGSLIKRLITDIDPQGLTSRQRGKAGYAAAICLRSLQQLRNQVNALRQPGFSPRDYTEKGYVLRGSIRTDGFRFSLLAFKIRELQSVRYRRYPAHVLPSPLLSTTGGTDSFLTEVRNVIHSQQDVQELFGCPADQIKILGIDLGHACLIGSFLLLPEPEVLDDGQLPPKEYNHLAVKTKAMYQPILKLRNWENMAKHRLLEDVPSSIKADILECEAVQPSSTPIQSVSASGLDVVAQEVAGSTPNAGLLKNESKDKYGMMSINAIESSMPALCGEHADGPAYFAYQQTHHDPLDSFYNGDEYRFKRHVWDAKKAKEEEYVRVANSLLHALGGSIGAKHDPDNKVIIAIGMSKFDWDKGLTSLDSSFQSYFVNKARSLGYLVVGVNEHYTSQKCPTCQNFVARVGKSYR